MTVSRAIRLLAMVGLAAGVLLMARPELVSLLPGMGPRPPCSEPIPWYVGEVDPRFDFTEREVTQAAAEASRVWNQAATRPLFQRDTVGMAIELVYDERQEASRERRRQREALEGLQADVARLEARLERLRRTVADEEAAYQQGPTRAAEADYQASVDRYNQAVRDYNRAVDRYNAAVEEARQDTGMSLQAGNLRTRSRTLNGRVVGVEHQLTVAVAESYDELVLVLTHELGHALGLLHLPDPDALMAEQYRSDDIARPVRLTPADRQALADLCAPES